MQQALTIKVPLGTVVYDEDTGAGHGKSMTELSQAKTGVAQAAAVAAAMPGLLRQREKRQGLLSREQRTQADRWVRLELKSVADIGLVGFPNVGKSPRCWRPLTRANPKIARLSLYDTVSKLRRSASRMAAPTRMADIPGLIEGASEAARAWDMNFCDISSVQGC